MRNPTDDDQNITWTREAWSALNQFSDGGVYLNFLGFQEEGEQLMRHNLERIMSDSLPSKNAMTQRTFSS